MCQFDTENSIVVMCNKVENELYRLTAQEINEQKTLIEWSIFWCCRAFKSILTVWRGRAFKYPHPKCASFS
jgi:hypothetical protein